MSTDLTKPSRAAAQLAVVLDVERMRGALEAAGRRANVPSTKVLVPKALSVGIGELVDVERESA
jgi:hypothetical protein